MFSNLTDFSRRRSALEALGFYIVYFLFGALLGAVAGAMGALVTGAKEFKEGLAAGIQWGAAIGVLLTLFLGGAICVRKSLAIGYYFIVVLGALLAVVGGSLLGLIPVAILTTRPNATGASAAG